MEKDNKIKNIAVETYAEDMAKVLENDTEGLVKKIIHEEEEHEEEKKNLSPESRRNKIFMLVGALLILLALATLSFFLFNRNIGTVKVEKQFMPLIFNDKTSFLEVSGLGKEEIAQIVSNQVNATQAKVGGVEGIYLTENKQIIGLRRFIAFIRSSFIPGDNMFFVSDNFLLGVVNAKTNTARISGEGFFILLKVRSTADIFDALRAWERKMFFDLYGFLGIKLSSDTNYLLTKGFEDGIVDNKNARILSDQNGEIVLTYVFADNNSVIISNSANAIHEIVLRLASASKKQ